MAAAPQRPPSPPEHVYDPYHNAYRYLHMPDTSWIRHRDPPEFDDALLQSLEQKRQELDAKVTRYIAKKQGQFNDYVAEKNRRYDLRADDRQKRRQAQHDRDQEQAMADVCDDQTPAPHLMDDDNEAKWFTKQREEDARKRAEAVSEEVAHSEPRHSSVPDVAAHPASLGSVRERDSEILQLLPGFLPLLEDQDQLSSSAPAANGANIRPARDPRSELVRSSTMPPVLKHSPAPRRSSLKQSNGERPGSARKAVRLSLGPRIVTPTQSPPDDRPLSSIESSAESSLSEETLRAIQREIEEADRWKSEPERVYTEEIPTEDLMSASASQDHHRAQETTVHNQIDTPASVSPEKGKSRAQAAGEEVSIDSSGPKKQQSPPQSKPNYAESPINFNKEEIPQRPSASLGRRSSLTEEAKSAPKEPKKKKKKKSKTQSITGLPTYTPVRAPTTTALSSTAPEIGASSARSIGPAYQPASPNASTSLLSSSFVDANNTGIFYPTRSRPPPSHMRPDETSLSAVEVPLPVGGFSSESVSNSYGSVLRGTSLGESFMALNFARRMAEREKAQNESAGRKKNSKAGSTSLQQPLKEEDEEDEEGRDSEAERLARKREEKYSRDRELDEDEFAGELDL
ncbi:uncharacterized protein BKCO1_1900055 [Diplodia corticola]|uniref:Uncharacterized protein n=1 Tax=Diplodia corticola TaxID=236234 RepID=A0A1J9S559_9PEZI|nr:uncharacterized protein BKCO1_1900055 [Diplodia corticola]OJD35084.1 hypothetical protein BKCO1_1900055 [Diplodia corticola]